MSAEAVGPDVDPRWPPDWPPDWPPNWPYAAPWRRKHVSLARLVDPRQTALPRPLVMTNGVFDLVHAGHVLGLDAARGLGACLVVALNSDASARGLGKGAGRPWQPEQARAVVLAALSSVDWIVTFDEPTPERVLRALRPDVYVKGADYSVEDLPETPLVRSWGGRVQLLPFVAGRSTTDIVHAIRATASATLMPSTPADKMPPA